MSTNKMRIYLLITVFLLSPPQSYSSVPSANCSSQYGKQRNCLSDMGVCFSEKGFAWQWSILLGEGLRIEMGKAFRRVPRMAMGEAFFGRRASHGNGVGFLERAFAWELGVLS
eukprot:GEMP01102021.1.p1 GENE.GEMP01102021.1~~GEMP01102021.1.p1  ORF type:complete len:113 (-),score=0.40 GEMP01102021.1:57-395(-)